LIWEKEIEKQKEENKIKDIWSFKKKIYKKDSPK
jgi:hypothetical protein